MGCIGLTMVTGLLIFATFMLMSTYVSAKRFTVGDNKGWTSNVNYTLWAANQTIYLNDWLFFNYDSYQNDVLEVNKTDYETCNLEHPLYSYTTGAGRDVVHLKVTRDYYFISSKGFCYGGMKLHVHVNNIPTLPRVAPAECHSSGITIAREQLFISMVIAVAVIWDSLV